MYDSACPTQSCTRTETRPATAATQSEDGQHKPSGNAKGVAGEYITYSTKSVYNRKLFPFCYVETFSLLFQNIL